MTYPQDSGVFTGKVKLAFRTLNQANMANQIRRYPIVIVNGPAGSGKTVITVALAIEALRAMKYDRVVISRPIVEAGENIGFLPGKVNEKTEVYMRPITEAFQFVQGVEENAMKDYKVEVVPLAYMRGRTFRKAFIILDEAQNATLSQLHLFLTRMDQDSICVVVGDTAQSDIPDSGFETIWLRARGRNFDFIATAELTEADMVRNPYLKEIQDLFKE